MRSRELYLDLLVRCISNVIYQDPSYAITGGRFDEETRRVGRDWPSLAHSMAGELRLRNLAELTQCMLDEGIPGDLIETGVWRGGCCILMKGVLAANGDTSRRVYVADSFDGLPPPDAAAYPVDAGLDLSIHRELAVSEAEVRRNFSLYGLLDDRVVTVPGFFRDTLPKLDVEELALMRLDGDLYESTILALAALYPRLSPGGIVIVDDYGCLAQCARAVDDYRATHGIEEPIVAIDWTGVYWRKAR
ncbi:MAG: macrocin O-methyltransferase [Hyphomicrobium sp. 32-62-53]|nr:MAG: macrocin O-methyltransferase [Hyphomicrobium sp. 32-62-53]